MSIKIRLFIAFSVLVTLVITISFLFVKYTQQTNFLLDKSISLSESRTLWQEISGSYEKQIRNLNYYLVLADSSEIDKFMEENEFINAKLKTIADSQAKDNFVQLYASFINSCRKMFNTQHPKVFEYFEKYVSKIEVQLDKEIVNLIRNYSEQLNAHQSEIKDISKQNFIISSLIGILSIIIGIVLGSITFISIWNPLKELIHGTQVIGKGNLDYKINISSEHEIGRLALSFNQMVENLKKLQLQVVQLDRMSSIGQLAGGVAHEINNPLSGILGQTQLLLEKIPVDDPKYQQLQKVEKAAQRCRKIVRALLDFAREKNYVFEPVNIGTLITETLNFCETEMRSGNIQIIKNIPLKLSPVRVSPGHIEQVFLNIISNAIQSMSPRGGILTITIKELKGMLDISFSDTGIGIKKEVLDHVFDPFFTTKDIGKGTGLGLTISYGIIQRHNGNITGYSAGDGKGSTFTVTLPI